LALLAEFEVGGKAGYEERYARPNTPHGYPGVMIAVAYDVGEHTVAELRADCKGILDDATIARLEPACGVHGVEAEPIARQLQDIFITWEQAAALCRKAILPKWIELVRKHLPNTDKLNPDSLGALVSLTFNRGASFSKQGHRFSEMRAIRQHMANREFEKIPSEIRAMKRLWPTLEGLQRRREREAELFERGLA
jgi:GH24 family phage-related lysozyme (muramidase)